MSKDMIDIFHTFLRSKTLLGLVPCPRILDQQNILEPPFHTIGSLSFHFRNQNGPLPLSQSLDPVQCMFPQNFLREVQDSQTSYIQIDVRGWLGGWIPESLINPFCHELAPIDVRWDWRQKFQHYIHYPINRNFIRNG